ncbi:MAG TPA: FAD-dependent thymidylate synthase [Thermoplasmata archaeon]|nr:FAD-dependent thymidylate synthase [Thermoplasmata archaeon]
MKLTHPVVILLAETHVRPEGVARLLETLGVSDEGGRRFREAPQGAETLIEMAGRLCYESFEVGLNPNVTKIRGTNKDYLENILSRGDGSILEHGVVSLAFLNVSRVLTHELVRHRVGVAISQESLRYVRLKEIKMWLPEELTDEQKERMIHAAEQSEEAYRRLAESIPWDTMSMDAKKRMTSALRRILPDGLATNIIWSANHRTLRWVIEMRTDPAAEVEIRMLFDQVAQLCIREWPNLYQDFDRTALPDGTGSWKPRLRSKV